MVITCRNALVKVSNSELLDGYHLQGNQSILIETAGVNICREPVLINLQSGKNNKTMLNVLCAHGGIAPNSTSSPGKTNPGIHHH